MLTYTDFRKTELRVAKIIKVSEHPQADRLYVITVEIGTDVRDIVAGIKKFYTPDELVGKYVVVVNNLEPAVIRGVQSSGMLLAASNQDSLTLITIDKPIQTGSEIK